MPSPQHQLAATLIPRMFPTREVSDVDKFRDALRRRNLTRQTTPPRGLARRWQIERRDIGFPAYVLTRRGSKPSRTLLHLHGGSFAAPAFRTQWTYATGLARAIDAQLVFPAYPLAPEHSWRDAHEPLVKLADSLAEELPLVMSGESAGGGLTLAVAETLRDRGGPQPSHLVLISPWADLTKTAPRMAEYAERDPWLSYENHDYYAEFWAGSRADIDRPEVSPALGRLDGLPPTLMFCGTRDMLFPSCEILARRGREAGWDVEFVVGEDLLHVYPIMPIPEGRAALKRTVAFLRD